MKRTSVFVVSFALAFLATALLGGLFWRAGNTPPTSTLDVVQKTKTIRCGYLIFEPFISKDLTTGRVSGIAADYLEQTAARKGVQIKWEKEVPIDQIVPALNYHQIDAFCTPCTPLTDWEKVLDFVGSFGKMPIYIYVPFDSKKTKEDLKTARFAVVDGFAQATITPQFFPSAKLVSLSNMASVAELYDQLKYGKADAVVNDHISAMAYMKNNPNIIRRLDETPIRTGQLYFPVQKGDVRWGGFMNEMTDTTDVENGKILDALIEKYGFGEGTLTK